MARARWLIVAVLGCSVLLCASGKDKKDKAKQEATQQVDSGSFGVFIRGQRVVTETFNVRQENGISDVKSRLQETGGTARAEQHSELQMSGKGKLGRYEWRDGRG